MAVTRTILPRKGLIQPQHGLTQYEQDFDANLALLDANVAFMSDVASLVASLIGDLGMNGILNGFEINSTSGLSPILFAGVLYAQGLRYAPSSPPVIDPAPPSATSYLFYNSSSGFYWQSSPAAADPTDAMIGECVTNTTDITAFTNATHVFGSVWATPSAAGDFSVPHLFGHVPIGLVIQMRSAGAIWFRTFAADDTLLYLTASELGVSAKVIIW